MLQKLQKITKTSVYRLSLQSISGLLMSSNLKKQAKPIMQTDV